MSEQLTASAEEETVVRLSEKIPRPVIACGSLICWVFTMAMCLRDRTGYDAQDQAAVGGHELSLRGLSARSRKLIAHVERERDIDMDLGILMVSTEPDHQKEEISVLCSRKGSYSMLDPDMSS